MTKRRGKGEGAIYQKADKKLWCAQIVTGYNPNGKCKRRYIYGKTKSEVQKKLSEMQSLVVSGNLMDPKKIRISEFLQHWLEDVVKPSVRSSTYLCYENSLRKHVIPNIGGLQLATLQPSHVQTLYRQLEVSGCSARTRELAHISLRCALGQAVRWNYIPKNICDLVQRPRVASKAMHCLTAEQTAQFLQHARSDRLFALYVLAIATGLRQGELFGLKWSDLESQMESLSVQRTVYEARSVLEINEPKTAAGRRRVDLPNIAAIALRQHRLKMLEEGNDSEWIFCDVKGGLLRRNNFRRRSFGPILKSSGLPHIRFHDLRHTAATLLLSQGIHPKVVQERLGHARISITLDIYSHVLPTMQREASAKMDLLLTGCIAEENL